MTTAFVPSLWSITTWRRLAICATGLTKALLVALTTVLIVGTRTGGSPQLSGSTPYYPACAPTTIVHAC
jgi:hypothetical protein